MGKIEVEREREREGGGGEGWGGGGGWRGGRKIETQRVRELRREQSAWYFSDNSLLMNMNAISYSSKTAYISEANRKLYQASSQI